MNKCHKMTSMCQMSSGDRKQYWLNSEYWCGGKNWILRESNCRKLISRPQASWHGREGECRNSNYEINHNRLWASISDHEFGTTTRIDAMRCLCQWQFVCETGSACLHPLPFQNENGIIPKTIILLLNHLRKASLKMALQKKNNNNREMRRKNLWYPRFPWLWFDTSPHFASVEFSGYCFYRNRQQIRKYDCKHKYKYIEQMGYSA